MNCMADSLIGPAMVLGMGAIALGLLAALVLAIFALGKYVFFR